MPVGNPKAQSIATRKYEKKTGWISKSYKLKKKWLRNLQKLVNRMERNRQQYLPE